MIIYGWRASHVKSEISDTITCSNCQSSKTTLFSVFSRYFHIFWIPLVPYGRKGGSVCQNCGMEFLSGEMVDPYKKAYIELRQQTRIPFWQFSGLLIIIVLVSYFTFANYQEEQNTAKFTAEPLIGDIYFYKSENGNFTSFILKQVDEDSVTVLHNNYESTTKSRLDEIDIPANYTDVYYRLPLDELSKMKTNNELIKVIRD